MNSHYPKLIRRVAYVLLTILIIFIGFMSAALMSYAAELTGKDTEVVELAEQIPNYTVMPGDEVRGSLSITNNSDYDYYCELAEDAWDLGAEVGYVGYRDATDTDVNGVYWDNAREVIGYRGADVQAHIDSGLWNSCEGYFTGKLLKPGESINVGYVFSFDGAKMTNIYQATKWDYRATLNWFKYNLPDEPQPPVPDEPIPSELELVEEQAELQPEVLYLRCTGYTGEEGYTGLTKSGTQVREGVLAGPDEWLGRSCELYDINGNSLGVYTFEDTGNPRYVNETRIDRWFSTGKDLKTWQKTVGDYVLLMWR